MRRSIGNIFDTVHAVTKPELVPTFPEDCDEWHCEQWITYYNALVTAVGKTQAQSIWRMDADNSSGFAYIKTDCPYHCDWLNWAQANGLDNISGWLPNLICFGDEVVSDAGAVVTDTTGAAATISKLILPLAFVIIGGAVFYGYNKIKK